MHWGVGNARNEGRASGDGRLGRGGAELDGTEAGWRRDVACYNRCGYGDFRDCLGGWRTDPAVRGRGRSYLTLLGGGAAPGGSGGRGRGRGRPYLTLLGGGSSPGGSGGRGRGRGRPYLTLLGGGSSPGGSGGRGRGRGRSYLTLLGGGSSPGGSGVVSAWCGAAGGHCRSQRGLRTATLAV